MAPLRAIQADMGIYGGSFGIGASLVLVIIICGCCGKKSSKGQDEKSKGSDKGKQGDTIELKKLGSNSKLDPQKSGKATEESKKGPEKSSLNEKQSKKLSDKSIGNDLKKAASVKGPSGPTASKISVSQKKVLQTKKAPAKKVPIPPHVGPEKVISTTPVNLAQMPKPLATSTPKMVLENPVTPAATPAPAPGLVAPTATPETPAPEGKGSGMEFLDGPPPDLAKTTITPKAGLAPGADATPVKPRVPRSEHVRSDDPAYRSLVGLEDAFGGGTEIGAPEMIPESQMAITAQSQSNLVPAQSMSYMSMVGKKTMKSGEKSKSKKKKKKEK